MRNVWIFSLLLVLLAGHFSFSQNETKKWYFGSAGGLDFVSGIPNVITSSSMSGYKEGTAGMADAFGNLLFYTDGTTIWDRSNVVMANGTGLFGSVVTSQAALIVKQPGSFSIYIVFTLGPGGLFYSIVDMNLAGGLGAVSVKNTPVASPLSEKLTGTKHCNGIDTWVVTHEKGTDVWRSLLVTAAGVSASATLSPIGYAWTDRYQNYGWAKISQNGKRLGCATYAPPNPFGNFEVYDFDNSNGKISNRIELTIPLNFPPVGPKPTVGPPPPVKLLPKPDVFFPYGCEFSPDASKLYGCGVSDTAIYQWNLCAGSEAAIKSSRYTLSSTRAAALALAKDGKIYAARNTKQVLGVINFPNLAGAACNYVANGPSIAPAICSYGLPNFISEVPYEPFSYIFSPSVSCNSATFNLPPSPTATITGCSVTGHSVNGHVWYFGDPPSGAANSSTLNNPSHAYPGAGIYTVSLVYYYNNSCGGLNTDTLKQEVKISSPKVSSPKGYDLCTGNSITLSIPGGAQSYSWSNGTTGSSVIVSPSVTTGYTVTGIDMHGCQFVSSQTVNVYQTPTISITGPTVLCPGYQTNLRSSGANTYSWSSGATSSLNIIAQWDPSVTYTVYGNANGCVTPATVTVVLRGPDILISGGNVTVCPGASVTLKSSGGYRYIWSDGSLDSVFVVKPTVTSTYSVIGMDTRWCSTTTTVEVSVQTKTPGTGFSFRSPVCNQSTETAIPLPAAGFSTGGVYSGQGLPIDSLTGKIKLSSANAGNYLVKYNFRKQYCIEPASTTVTLAIEGPAPLTISGDTKLQPGSTTELKVSGGTTYSWSASPYLSCVDCPAPVASPPETTEFCVTSDANTCRSTECVTVSITCDTNNDYSVPTAFTPNGDGKNDEFCLQGWDACTTSFKVMIYNRWGEKVFESSEANFCWNGNHKGMPLGSDVFVYVMTAQKFDKTPLDRKGTITLIR